MAYSLTWMPGVLREAGLNVVEIGGWQNRGHGNFSGVRGVLLHHTAGPASGNFPSQNVVVNGRPGLAGPLCNLGLGRDGTWFIVAAGLAYHAGAGYVSWCGRDNGNNHLIGVEAESTGRGDWTSAQHESYPRGVAALLSHVGLGPERALAHKEWAPGRKIDPAGWPGDMGGFRGSVGEWMEGGMPSPEEIATAVWSHILAQPDQPENKQAAWVWLTYANVAAWRSADALPQLPAAVWNQVLDNPDDPNIKHAAWVWLTYANIAAWKAAGQPNQPSEIKDPDINKRLASAAADTLQQRRADLTDEQLAAVARAAQEELDRRKAA
ncbi:peptidoglycan recognition protein family protein [Allokutzneria albata]|uniref:N-acetylmuramoyl-L-alanine amidase n=1 Tax=Allokutzneria albata TaxID=211114 RepID=A0A1H0AKB8_ALLAB|nr:N-acetylmuramoyl-L-alanine amidase [Allokutzneria albata]SDN33835.1 N-acetylmuramoyl-L-alanine amidase [Allokutzneria albata]